MNGVVTEDRLTGDRYVTNVMIVQDTVSARPQESEQRDSQSTAKGMTLSSSDFSFLMHVRFIIMLCR